MHSKLAALYVQKSHDSMQGSHDYTKSHDSWLQTQDSPSTCSTWLLDSHGETTEKLQSDSDCAQTEACELLREAAPDGDTAAMESVEQSKNGSEGGSEGDGQGRDGSEGDGQGRDGSEGDGQGRDGSEGDSQGRNKKKKRRGDKQKTEQVAMEPVPGWYSHTTVPVPCIHPESCAYKDDVVNFTHSLNCIFLCRQLLLGYQLYCTIYAYPLNNTLHLWTY